MAQRHHRYYKSQMAASQAMQKIWMPCCMRHGCPSFRCTGIVLSLHGKHLNSASALTLEGTA
eukprot:8328723-Karenia_brevis.AAC.1